MIIKEKDDGYYSKCNLYLELRKTFNKNGVFLELEPEEFYKHV